MSANNDPTGGLRLLLANDDLVMVQVNKGSGENVSTSLLTMDTSNSMVPHAPQTTAINTTDASGAFNRNAGVLASEAAGRMFNINNDTVAVLNVGDDSSGKTWSFTLIDPRAKFQSTTALNSKFRPSGTIFTNVVMGDFNGDKFADPLVIYTSVAPDLSIQWGMKVLTAVDPKTEAAPREGPELYGSSSTGLTPIDGAIAVGDFNGDGLDEIAVLQNDEQTILFYSVDPKTLTITPIPVTPTVKLPFPMVSGQVTLAAGRFRGGTSQATHVTGITNADLVAFGQISRKADGYSVIPILITPQSGILFTASVVEMPNATNDKPFFRFPDFHEAYGAIAQAAPLIYFPQDAVQQLVLGIRTHDGAGYIQIGSFALDDKLDQFYWESQTELNAAENGTDLISMAVGNFDNQNSDGSHNAGWQIEAFTMEDGGIQHVRIYDVNSPPPPPPPPPPPTTPPYYVPYAPPPNPSKPDDWLKQKTNFNFGKDSDFLMGVVLPGDIQGRSLRLGAPTIVRIISQLQPDLVLAIPPMHVDWLLPSNIAQNDLPPNCLKTFPMPCLLNLTVKPSVEPGKGTPFTSSFTSISTKTQTSKKSATTSWGISVKETVGGSATFNDGLENASASFKNTTSAAHDQTVASKYDDYTGDSKTLTSTTGFADYIFFTSKGMNVYYYPVLSNDIPCSLTSSTCDAYVEFSVPDNITYTDSDGTTQEWYQPVHEPGNVLSYPWNKAQLQAQFVDKVVPLTQDPPTCSLIGTGTQTSTTKWTNGSTSDQSSGTTNSFSDDASMSYSEGAGVSGVDAADFNFSLDLGVNTSLKTLNESISSVTGSQGVTVNQPGFPVAADCCSYGLAGYIFGQVSADHPSGQLACKPGQTSGCLPVNDGNGNQTAITSTGPLFSGFIADVKPDSLGLNCGGGANGNWWVRKYNQPDIALNHPLRWSWDKSSMTVTLNVPNRDATALGQPFYQMKGFFITKPVAKGSSSPNLQTATIGDDLTLTTRVYNYSLTPTTDTVHVRFYGQLFCRSAGGNESSCSDQIIGRCAADTLCGNSFEIGETTIASIQGFKSSVEGGGLDLPNWTTASIDFPTSKFISAQGNASMVFWVVVWMQDSNGHLVPEMIDHGLTSIPGNLFQATEVPIESYSNNVGMYGMNSPFYIAPKTEPGSVKTIGSLKKLTVSTSKRIMLDQRTAVTANLTATGGSGESVTIAYFDGNPSKNGILVDVQHIQHMDAEIPYTHRVFFNPDSCGVHTLYAQAWIPNSQAIQSSFTTDVIIQPTDRVKQLRAATESTNFKDRLIRQELLILLDTALEGYRINPDSILGSALLKTYVKKLKSASGKDVTAEAANLLIDQADIIAGCTKRFD